MMDVTNESQMMINGATFRECEFSHACDLRHADNNGPDHGWRAAAPVSQGALLLHDANQRIENVFIITALGDGQPAIRLHAHQTNLDGVAEEGCRATSENT